MEKVAPLFELVELILRMNIMFNDILYSSQFNLSMSAGFLVIKCTFSVNLSKNIAYVNFLYTLETSKWS